MSMFLDSASPTTAHVGAGALTRPRSNAPQSSPARTRASGPTWFVMGELAWPIWTPAPFSDYPLLPWTDEPSFKAQQPARQLLHCRMPQPPQQPRTTKISNQSSRRSPSSTTKPCNACKSDSAGSWPGYVFTGDPLHLAAGHFGLGHGSAHTLRMSIT